MDPTSIDLGQKNGRHRNRQTAAQCALHTLHRAALWHCHGVACELLSLLTLLHREGQGEEDNLKRYSVDVVRRDGHAQRSKGLKRRTCRTTLATCELRPQLAFEDIDDEAAVAGPIPLPLQRRLLLVRQPVLIDLLLLALLISGTCIFVVLLGIVLGTWLGRRRRALRKVQMRRHRRRRRPRRRRWAADGRGGAAAGRRRRLAGRLSAAVAAARLLTHGFAILAGVAAAPGAVRARGPLLRAPGAAVAAAPEARGLRGRGLGPGLPGCPEEREAHARRTHVWPILAVALAAGADAAAGHRRPAASGVLEADAAAAVAAGTAAAATAGGVLGRGLRKRCKFGIGGPGREQRAVG
mmetsp:Transcript_56643/g.184272  ORF Transcript_56643/g.184272 Transcript_56643/m.184272 type:complete len:353 (-) Transcript_56643:1078-2136(-)